ncbi:MAG TPA: hypothetical protein PLI95_04435 [Polyangiaceae bacterium]|nr:hypothetical protein [Polyangiaceae bacterium]
MSDPIPLALDALAIPVDAAPGDEIALRGSLYSSHDGSRIDAAATFWPADAPGGPSIDPGGWFDLEGGGFRLVSHDAHTHEVHAIATGGAAPACNALGVSSPCLPLRLNHQARSRLLGSSDWTASLSGQLDLWVEASSAATPSPAIATRLPSPAVLFATLLAAVVLVTVLVLFRRRSRSPAGRLAAQARRVRRKLCRTSPLLAANLRSSLDNTLRDLRRGSLDAGSEHGVRISATLGRLERSLDEEAMRARAERDRKHADALGDQVEVALEAAREVTRLCG